VGRAVEPCDSQLLSFRIEPAYAWQNVHAYVHGAMLEMQEGLWKIESMPKPINILWPSALENNSRVQAGPKTQRIT
jgi:hypothetical protein